MMGCPVCDGNTWTKLLVVNDIYTGTPYMVQRCTHCGLTKTVVNDEQPSTDLYRYEGSCDAGKRFVLLQRALRAIQRTRLHTIAARMPGRALDVGCGDGSFLATLAQQGWDIFGTELSTSIATTAQLCLGDRVHVGPLEKIGFAPASFDLVTFWHVLEHLEHPTLALTEARRLVKADGQVVVAVPNIDSLQARLFASDWLHLDVPRHRWHFSPRTLSAAADRCHLRVESIRHFSLEYGPFAIIQGVATKIGLGHSLYARLMRLPPSQLIRERLFWVHLPLLAITAAPSVLLELVAALCNRGGAIVMTLRPK